MGIGLIYSIGPLKPTPLVGMELMYIRFKMQGFPVLVCAIVKQSIELTKEEWQNRWLDTLHWWSSGKHLWI